ncbi:MAG: hypothetical protein NC078_03410 [Ruminococcus sp.]|nr:hypothetical protein [Ruminococcus sp.]
MLGTPALLLRKKVITDKLLEMGCIGKENAVGIESIGLPFPDAFPKVTEELIK